VSLHECVKDRLRDSSVLARSRNIRHNYHVLRPTSSKRVRRKGPVQGSLFSRAELAQPERPRRGRPKKPGAGLPHTRRPAVDSRHPHHVTVRMRKGVWNLRSQRCFRPIATALRKVRMRGDFRVVHFSVQGNHLHLVTEANDRRSMTQGMRALLIRIAKRLNRVMGGRGRLFADRFHERVLRSPTEVRNVVRYVLQNQHKHYANRQPPPVDPFSSANEALDHPTNGPPWAQPDSWLLRVGWLETSRTPPSRVDADTGRT